MGRGSGFSSILTAIARDIARSQRQAEVARRRAFRENERLLRIAQREDARQMKVADKEAKLQYFEDRISEADEKTSEILSFIAELSSILTHTFSVNDEIAFDSLKVTEVFEEFSAPPELTSKSSPPLSENFSVRKPNQVAMLFPWVAKKYRGKLVEEEKGYKEALQEYELKEKSRNEQIASEHSEYEKAKKAFEQKIVQRDQEIDD